MKGKKREVRLRGIEKEGDGYEVRLRGRGNGGKDLGRSE